MTQPLCRKNKYGHCMFGEKCRYRHNNVVCVENNCNVFKCEKRHPKICNYFSDYGQCKFTTYCSYKHLQRKDTENFEKIKEIEKKMFELEKNSNNNASATEEKKIVKKIEAFEKEIENKMLTFETKIKHFIEVVEEKDCKIAELEKQLQEIKDKFADLTKKEKTSKQKEFKCTY